MAGAVIGGVVGLAGASMASSATKDAANTAADATRDANAANLQLARETRDENEALYSGYITDEDKAQSYLDALLYGQGSYGGESGQTSGAIASDTELRERFPSQLATWNKFKTSTKASFGSFANYLTATMGEAALAPENPTPVTNVTRDDAMALVYGSPLYGWNEEEYLRAQGFTDDEVAAWEAEAQAQADTSRDALFSRLGVTGQTGATTRGVAQVGEDYARDRAQYEASRRRGDYDAYTAGRYNSYADVVGQLSGRTDRGERARSSVASGGQTYAQIASNANTANANAAATAAYQRGQANATLYSDLANVAGRTYGAYQNRQSQPLTPTYYYAAPMSYTQPALPAISSYGGR